MPKKTLSKIRRPLKITVSPQGDTLVVYIPIKTVFKQITTKIPRRPGQLVRGLTKREQEVFQGLCEGLRGKEIANRLNISLRTVKYYLSRIYGSMNMDRGQIMVNFGTPTARRMKICYPTTLCNFDGCVAQLLKVKSK